MPSNSAPNSSNPQPDPKQIAYRDARFTKQYDGIWQSVGKCVFCDLRDKYILFEEQGIVLTVSLFAYTDGHMMIIPRRHVRSAKELTPLEWETIRKFTYIAKRLAKKVRGIGEIVYVLRDGGVDVNSTVPDHLHLHAIPSNDPKLTTWNYHRLQDTPAESAIRYRQARKELIESKLKFEKKYQPPHSLPLVVDLLWLVSGHLLFQERQVGQKFHPDVIGLPGGVVDDFTKPFTEELAREVHEETNGLITASDCQLIASRVSRMNKPTASPHLKVTYPKLRTFIWNTYLLKQTGPLPQLTPGDDCAELLWIPVKEVAGHNRISPEIKTLVAQLHSQGQLS